jgi:hypothetical protein
VGDHQYIPIWRRRDGQTRLQWTIEDGRRLMAVWTDLMPIVARRARYGRNRRDLKFVSSAFAAKASAHYEVVQMLAETGHAGEVVILARVLVELMVNLALMKAESDPDSAAERFWDFRFVDRVIMLDRLSRFGVNITPGPGADMTRDDLDKEIDRVMTRFPVLKNTKGKPRKRWTGNDSFEQDLGGFLRLNPKHAEAVKLVYTGASCPIHSSPFALEHYVAFPRPSTVEFTRGSLRYLGPALDASQAALILAMETMTEALGMRGKLDKLYAKHGLHPPITHV